MKRRAAMVMLWSSALVACARAPEFEDWPDGGDAYVDELDEDDGAAADDDEPPTSGKRDSGVSKRDAGQPNAESGAETRDAGAGTVRDAAVVDAGRTTTAPDAGGTRDAGTSTGVVDAGGPRDAGQVAAKPDAGGGTGAGSSCRAGTYTGTFDGKLSVALGVEHTVKGTVTLPVVAAAGGDTLQFTSGTMTGSDEDKNAVSAKISGSFRCSAGTLTDGRISELVYARRFLLSSSTRYTGSLTGSYTAASSAANGSWRADAQTGTGSGSGSWTVKLP